MKLKEKYTLYFLLFMLGGFLSSESALSFSMVVTLFNGVEKGWGVAMAGLPVGTIILLTFISSGRNMDPYFRSFVIGSGVGLIAVCPFLYKVLPLLNISHG